MEIMILNKDSEYLNEVVSLIADWHLDSMNVSKERSEYFARRCVEENRIPQTIILVSDNKLIGFYQIIMNDLSQRPDIYPWIANVYIKDEYRSNGYGRKLIESIPKFVKKLGIKKIYLHSSKENLYEKFGWKYLESVPSFKEEKLDKRIFVLDID